MNGAGKISWTEFLAATIEAIGRVGEEEFAECFARLDCDSSGFISTEVCLQLYFTEISWIKYSLTWSSPELERDTWRFAR